MRAKYVNESERGKSPSLSMTFKRAADPVEAMGIGRKAQIYKFFDDLNIARENYTVEENNDIIFHRNLLLHSNDLAWQKPITLPSELKFVDGCLDLEDIKIESLPENLEVNGSVYLQKCPITSLPKNFKVKGDIDLTESKIVSIPDGFKVGGYLSLIDTPISSLPNDLSIGLSLVISGTNISSWPKRLSVGVATKKVGFSVLDISNSKISNSKLPKDLTLVNTDVYR